MLSKSGQQRCEWCGAAASAPRNGERDRLAAVLEQMPKQPPAYVVSASSTTRTTGTGVASSVRSLFSVA